MVKSAAKRLLEQGKSGNWAAFGQLLTWLEKHGAAEAFAIPDLLQPKNLAVRLGITGPPGAGKSTLVAQLIKYLRAKNLKVGVVAVDPSSPFSGGAILGDRIRYNQHATDPGVFVRSLGSRGSLGGISASAYLILRAFDACNFDVVLIETVGVGQTELDVLHVADQVTVVLVPESGDSIQAMKAGLMEIADVFLVNKADRPGADSLVREIQVSVHEGESSRQPQVFAVVATEGKGLEAWEKFVAARIDAGVDRAQRLAPKRLREEAKALLRREWETKLNAKLKTLKTPSQLKTLLR